MAVFQDLFTDDNNTILPDHSPDIGTGWTLLAFVDGAGDDAKITNSNELDSGDFGLNDGFIYTADATYLSANYKVEVDSVNADNGDDFNYIFARIQDSDNFYALEFNEVVFQLYKKTTASGWETIGSDAGTLVVDGDTVKLEVDGTSIKGYVNDTQQASGTDSTITGTGKAGLGMGAMRDTAADSSAQVMDNFVVTDLTFGLTETHTTDSLKRAPIIKTHTTDANLEAVGIRVHTTDAALTRDDLISDFEITGITGTTVNADNTKFSIRFTARENKTVDKIRLFTNTQTGGDFKVGLQADSSGEPSGTWLGGGSGNAVIGTWAGNDWSAYGTLSTSVALTSGVVYHIVMERDQSGSGNTQFRELEPHLKRWSYDNAADSNQNTLFYNGTSWSVRDKTPIFLFEYTDATFRGQSNTNGRDHALETDDREGIEFTGNDKTYKSFAFSVKKLGSPPNNIDYVLYDVTGDVEVESGTFVAPGDVTTSYAFIVKNFSSDRTFSSSNVYQLVLNTSGGDGSNNYDVQGVEQFRGEAPGDSDVYGQGFFGTIIIDTFGSAAPPLTSTVNYIDQLFKLLADAGLQSFTKTHTTDSNKRKVTTKIHTTDASKKEALTKTHTTDALKRTEFTKIHTTDANKKKETVSTHTTDALKRKIAEVNHTTDTYRQKAFTITHTSDANKKKALETNHTTDALKREELIVEHSTDALKKTSPEVSHTTDSLKRKSLTIEHTTDANKKKIGITVEHSTDANLTAFFIKSHTTDTSKRKETTASHTTDSLKRKVSAKEHSTDALKKKELVKNHTTDSLLHKESTLSHTTDSFLNKEFIVTHSTDTNKQKALTAIHTTDSFLFVTEATTKTVQAKANIFATSTKTLTAKGRVLTTAEFLEGYSYRQPITIDNTANSDELTEYQVKITVDHAQLVTDSKSNSDGSDFRFTDSNASTLLYFWVESGLNTSSCVLWVRVPTIPASVEKTIYFYYDPSTKDNISNGYDTFDFFDDFEIELNTDVWDVQTSTSYTVSSSILRINQGAIGLNSALGFNLEDGYMVEGRTRYENTTTGHSSVLEVSSSQFIASSNGNSDALILYMRKNTATLTDVHEWVANGSTASYNISSNSFVFSSTNSTWYILGDETTSSTAATWKDYSRQNDHTSITWSKNINYIALGSFAGSGSTDVQDTSYDWVRARKFDREDPTTSVGSEEAQLPNTEESKGRIKVVDVIKVLDSLGRVERLETTTLSAKAWLNRASTIASKAKILNHQDVVRINDILLPIPSGSKIVPLYKWGKHDSIGGKDRREKYGKKYRYEIVWKFMKKGEYETLENLVNSGEPVTLKYERYPQSEDGVLVLVKLSERPHVALTGVNNFYSGVSIAAVEVNIQ